MFSVEMSTCELTTMNLPTEAVSFQQPVDLNVLLPDKNNNGLVRKKATAMVVIQRC